MRSGPLSRHAAVWRQLRRSARPLGAAWRRFGFGRPLAAGLTLVLIAALATGGKALLGVAADGLDAAERGWPTTVAGGFGAGGFSPDDALSPAGERLSEGELEAVLTSLKQGAFGVAFAPVTAAAPGNPALSLESTAPAAGSALVPVVLIDAAQPPLRIDIMGLAPATGDGAAADASAPGGASQ
jgi:hypothetical protein